MIDELHVKNVALIKEANLEFSQGLTVLTGETGTGKTALLSALRLVSGQRADAKAVRDGALEAAVELRCFDGDNEHVYSRRLSSTGRSRCSVDGSLSAVGQLACELSFVKIHSQHEQIALLKPENQVAFLDRFIDPTCAHLEPYRDALSSYRSASKRFKELEQASKTQGQELEYQRFVASQIAAVNPREGEYEELQAQLPRLQNAASLLDACTNALRLTGADEGAAQLLGEAVAELERASGLDDDLAGFAQRAQEISSVLDDFVFDISSYARSLDADPCALQENLDRTAALSGLMRRYGPTMQQVLQAWQNANQCISAAQGDPQLLAQAKQERNRALQQLKERGQELQALRRDKAAQLCANLASTVSMLAMPDASFEFAFEDAAGARWTDAGPGAAELMYRPSPQASARPLRKIASGGELSRILLALECVLREDDAAAGTETLVFDEVDAGIGGAAGEAVGLCLARLAKHTQVIVVTHLAQVAAHADAHIVVSKSEAQGSVETVVASVSGQERVAEIARMLSGSDGAEALAHAAKLLKEASKL